VIIPMDNSGFVDVPLDQLNEDIPTGSQPVVKGIQNFHFFIF